MLFDFIVAIIASPSGAQVVVGVVVVYEILTSVDYEDAWYSAIAGCMILAVFILIDYFARRGRLE